MTSLTRYTAALQTTPSYVTTLTTLTKAQNSLLQAALGAMLKDGVDFWRDCEKAPAVRKVLTASVDDQRALLACLAVTEAHLVEGPLVGLMRELISNDGVLDRATTALLLKTIVEDFYSKYVDNTVTVIVAHVEALHKRGELSGLEDDIRLFLERNQVFWSLGRPPRVLEAKLKRIVGDGLELRLPLDNRDAPWVDALQQDFEQLPEAEQTAWAGLIAHGMTGSGTAPSATWLKKATALTNTLPAGALSTTLARWFPALQHTGDYMAEGNEATVKCLIWLAGVGDTKLLAPLLGDLAIAFYSKVRWQGPKSRILGNACIQILCLLDKPGVVQLSRLRSKISYNQGKALVEKSVIRAAERAGLTPEDMEEASVPDMGFDADGIARFVFGSATALLRLEGEGRLATEWYNADGKALKSAPAEVKRDYGDTFKDWQKETKAFADAVLGQRTRFEQAYLRQREWALEEWRTRFIDSTELLGWMGRRLIWTVEFSGQVLHVIGLEGTLRDLDGNAVAALPDNARVTLWHPIHASAAQVLMWREKLQQAEVVQPMRQAFREVYLLTDAERESGVLSRRFAGHLLRQFQLNALLQMRSWSYTLQGSWDGHNTPHKPLPRWALGVAFKMDPKEEFLGVTGETGVYAYVESGEFYFYGEKTGGVSLIDVPPLLFSEVLRDMDLFVGVCSVANDPERRLVEDPAFARYISVASEAELQGGAQVRRDLLDNILSRLPIGKRCSLDGRYLIVKGDLRTYRIHLGSSNILMEPNNQYLCIVQDKKNKSDGGGIYLPFEGDTLLSLILSKALLLADDRKIKDPSILSQIKA